jgi:hypothetical protein
MLHRTRVIRVGCVIAFLFLSMAIVQSLPAQAVPKLFPRDDRLRFHLPPQNPPAGVLNGGTNFGFTPAPPIAATQLGQKVLVGGNLGAGGNQFGNIGNSGNIGQIGGVGGNGNLGQLGLSGSLGALGSIGSLGSLGSIGSLGIGGSLGAVGIGGSLGALGAIGGSIGAFGGGAFGKSGAIGANGAIGL